MRCKYPLALGVLLLCAGWSAFPLSAANAPRVQIQDAWIRWLPADLPAGGYVVLVNMGDQPATLLGASSPDYATVSLHRSLNRNGTTQMTPVSQITIPAHSSLDFAATGYHLMLQQPRRPLNPGDHVTITLSFAGASALSVQFELRKADASQATPPQHSDMKDMPGMSGMVH
jgi:copper(I)-binding protein